jgi:CrcB protein
MKPFDYMLVFLGGGLGSMARLALSYALAGSLWLHLGTLVANMAAALVAGALAQRLANGALAQVFAFLLTAGFCGGLSTFSTFSIESLKFLQQHQWVLFLSHALLHMVLSLVAALSGWWLSALIMRNMYL